MAKTTIVLNGQEDIAEITINGFKIVEIINRTDELFLEIQVFDTEEAQVLTQTIGTGTLKLFEED